MKKFNIKLILFFIISQFFAYSVSASEILEIKAEAGMQNIKINWQSASLTETESAVLFRKENKCPEFYGDGEEIYRGNGEEYADKEITKNKKYCYGVFIYDLSGRISEIKKTALMEKMGLGEYVARILIAKNNLFIVLEVVVFLFLVWLNLKRRGFFAKKRRLKIIRVDED